MKNFRKTEYHVKCVKNTLMSFVLKKNMKKKHLLVAYIKINRNN